MSEHAGLVLCRNWTAIPVPDPGILESWARLGRVQPDDYLVDPLLETCLQAREIPELQRIFRRTAARRFERVCRVLGLVLVAVAGLMYVV